jgi:imidazolonepropionase
LPLAIALAVRSYGMSVAEALLGATREAAATLGLAASTGVICPGFAADLALWDFPHENAIAMPWGVSRTLAVYRDGRRLH